MGLQSVLCVDDEESCLLYGELFFQINRSFKVASAVTFQEAADLIGRELFQLYIIEPYRLGKDGFELCKIIRNRDSRSLILIYSGMSREIDRRAAFAAGANNYFVKADDFDEFIETVERILSAG